MCNTLTDTTKHNIENVKIIARETNLERCLFLEAWYSIEDPNSENTISACLTSTNHCANNRFCFYCTCFLSFPFKVGAFSKGCLKPFLNLFSTFYFIGNCTYHERKIAIKSYFSDCTFCVSEIVMIMSNW